MVTDITTPGIPLTINETRRMSTTFRMATPIMKNSSTNSTLYCGSYTGGISYGNKPEIKVTLKYNVKPKLKLRYIIITGLYSKTTTVAKAADSLRQKDKAKGRQKLKTISLKLCN